MSSGHAGMQRGVQRALGYLQGQHRETVVCGCGAEKQFGTNAIGQMTEHCPRCRTTKIYLATRRFEVVDDA